jgi:hypothetical protein
MIAVCVTYANYTLYRLIYSAYIEQAMLLNSDVKLTVHLSSNYDVYVYNIHMQSFSSS